MERFSPWLPPLPQTGMPSGRFPLEVNGCVADTLRYPAVPRPGWVATGSAVLDLVPVRSRVTEQAPSQMTGPTPAATNSTTELISTINAQGLAANHPLRHDHLPKSSRRFPSVPFIDSKGNRKTRRVESRTGVLPNRVVNIVSAGVASTFGRGVGVIVRGIPHHTDRVFGSKPLPSGRYRVRTTLSADSASTATWRNLGTCPTRCRSISSRPPGSTDSPPVAHARHRNRYCGGSADANAMVGASSNTISNSGLSICCIFK